MHMKPIAKFARANLRGVPGFSTLSKSGKAKNPKALVSSALSMANSAAPYAAEPDSARAAPRKSCISKCHNGDCALTLNSDGAAPSRLSGNP